jgi:hypothetical protein
LVRGLRKDSNSYTKCSLKNEYFMREWFVSQWLHFGGVASHKHSRSASRARITIISSLGVLGALSPPRCRLQMICVSTNSRHICDELCSSPPSVLDCGRKCKDEVDLHCDDARILRMSRTRTEEAARIPKYQVSTAFTSIDFCCCLTARILIKIL